MRLIVENAHQRAKQILTENREQLEVLAKNLLEYETLTGAEIRALVNGEKIDRTHNDSAKPPTRSSVPSSRKPIITMGENPLPA